MKTKVAAYVEGDALEAGDYTLELTGRVKDNLVTGTTRSSLGGKTIATEAGFGRRAVPISKRT